jgi:PAB-dependent poly(A)-specific ribonuclease subunit 2
MCCGSASGHISLRDSRTLNVEHSLDAHKGALLDMDVSGNLLASAGCSIRSGKMALEPMIKLYDIRTMRALPPLSFPAGASFLSFNPVLSSILFASSQTGNFQICDTTNPNENISFHQVSA